MSLCVHNHTAPPHLHCRLLNTFQSTLDEVSIIALPAHQATAATGGGQAAAAQRCVKLQSFYDPAKGEQQWTPFVLAGDAGL